MTVGLGLVIAAPFGIAAGMYAALRPDSRIGIIIRFSTDTLAGVPSIVMGIFAYTIVVLPQGHFSALAGGIVLAFIMLPILVRTTEEMLKLVPNELREASYALGVPKWKTIARVVLPTAFSGIVTGILLGLARIMGETAPLLILGPYTANIASNLFGGFMATLPTMINTNRVESLQPAIDRTWASALTLILVILLLNLAGRLVARTSKVKD
jgi:phosphate transport system permease protein